MHIITSKTLATRRNILRQLALGGAMLSTRGLYAEALTLTAKLTEGPFYPNNTPFNNIPLDKDNDLVLVNDSLTPADGLITHLAGRVLNEKGQPVRGALVEIWHTDHHGQYLYSTEAERNPAMDKNFAGFGQFLTGKDGAYRFRTIKAGLYGGRTRHIHAGITLPGEKIRMATQLFWNEIPRDEKGNVWPVTNENDGVMRHLSDPVQRASLIRDFTKVTSSAVNEESTVWDVVMGTTVLEPSYPNTPGGELVVKGEPIPGASKPRWRVTVPAYPGYAYEVYGDPVKGALGWAALPFAMEAKGKIDRNITQAEKEGSLDLYVEKESAKGFYLVGFRVPGANLGTPGVRGGPGTGPRRGPGPGPGPGSGSGPRQAQGQGGPPAQGPPRPRGPLDF